MCAYENWQMNYINFYCENDLKELKKICDPILKEKNIPVMNHDDLYEIAMECLCDSVKTYSEEKSQFKTYLTGNIKRKFYTFMRDSTRGCRCNVEKDKKGRIVLDSNGNSKVIYDTSIYSETEDGCVLGDIIESSYNLEEEVISSIETEPNDKIAKYLKSLTKMQRKIINLLVEGYERKEIIKKLGLKDREYTDNLDGIRSFNRVKILY